MVIENSEKFLGLADIHLSALYRFACELAGDEAHAGRLLAKTLKEAVRSLSQFVPGSNFKVWLFHLMLLASGKEIKEAVEFQAHSLKHDTLQERFDELPREHHLPLVLSIAENFCYREISQILDLSREEVFELVGKGYHLLERGTETKGNQPVVCQEPLADLHAFIDHEILDDVGKAGAILAHLNSCPDCYQQYRKAKDVKLGIRARKAATQVPRHLRAEVRKMMAQDALDGRG